MSFCLKQKCPTPGQQATNLTEALWKERVPPNTATLAGINLHSFSRESQRHQSDHLLRSPWCQPLGRLKMQNAPDVKNQVTNCWLHQSREMKQWYVNLQRKGCRMSATGRRLLWLRYSFFSLLHELQFWSWQREGAKKENERQRSRTICQTNPHRPFDPRPTCLLCGFCFLANNCDV